MSSSRIAVTTPRRIDGKTSGRPEPSADVEARLLPRRETRAARTVRISSQAFELAREIAPGWDRYALEQIYIGRASKLEEARNEDARFISWVRSYTKGKPP